MIIRIAWANVVLRPLTTTLSLLLLSFGVGIISLLLVVNGQLQDKFANDLAGTDLVLGAKGSPLQLVLSAVYHLDAPPGNISLAEAETAVSHMDLDDDADDTSAETPSSLLDQDEFGTGIGEHDWSDPRDMSDIGELMP